MFFNNNCMPRECCCQKEEKPRFFCKKRIVEVVDIFKIEKVGTRCVKDRKDNDCGDKDDFDCGEDFDGHSDHGHHFG